MTNEEILSRAMDAAYRMPTGGNIGGNADERIRAAVEEALRLTALSAGEGTDRALLRRLVAAYDVTLNPKHRLARIGCSISTEIHEAWCAVLDALAAPAPQEETNNGHGSGVDLGGADRACGRRDGRGVVAVDHCEGNCTSSLVTDPAPPAREDLDYRVLNSSYGWTVDIYGNVCGLTAGDMLYEPTGITISKEHLLAYADAVREDSATPASAPVTHYVAREGRTGDPLWEPRTGDPASAPEEFHPGNCIVCGRDLSTTTWSEVIPTQRRCRPACKSAPEGDGA